MKKFIFIFLVFVLSVGKIIAGNPPDPEGEKNSISFNLVTPFDPNFPRFRIGYTQFFSDSWSQTFEFGYGSQLLFPDSAFYTNQVLQHNYRLIEFRSQVRYYFAGMREHIMPYAGVELYYIHHTQNMFSGSFLSKDEITWIDYSKADYLRQKSGINMTFGLIAKFNKVLAIEPYAGFGIRLRKNSYHNVEIINQSPGGPFLEQFNYYYHEGTQWNMNLAYGVRICFMF